MSRPTVTLLGGGSAFTAAFVDAIVRSDYCRQARRLILFGRERRALDIIEQHARLRLDRFGWAVASTTDLDEALNGVQFVIHQIRYGGLEGREEGERLADLFGLPADETLGPAALQSALRSASAIRRTAARIAARCADAWTLNLTNPLSITTALMIREGVRRCLGVCELPEVTAGAVAALLGVRADRLRWAYSGLNHRGFLHHFSLDGEPTMDAILSALASRTLPGIEARDVAWLQAVPLKYFRLVQAPVRTPPRARVLRELRAAVMRELAECPGVVPPSLGRRNLDWYAKAVVPLLSALAAGDGRLRVVNIMGPEGLVIESKARIERDRVTAVEAPSPPPAVKSWIQRFIEHERAFLQATITMSEADIGQALTLDPLVSAAQVRALTHELLGAQGY